MKKKSSSHKAFFNCRVSMAVAFFLSAVFLALLTTANPQSLARKHAASSEPSGIVQEAWVARYNGPGNAVDEAKAIAIDSSGNVYVTGRSNGGPGADFDYATVKYNSTGQEQWVARYNGPENGDDHAVAIAVDNSGNVYVTGTSSTYYATIRYNSTGQEQWVVRYGPSGGSVATALALDNAGNIYVTGYSPGPDGSPDYTTIKYDPTGQQQWVTRYNGPAAVAGDYAEAITVDSAGNVYVTGESQGPTSSYDYATIKYDSAGQEQWVARYNGPGNHLDEAYAIAVDGSGNVYVTGGSAGSGGEDYATIKYDSSGQQQWVIRYNGPGNFFDHAEAIAIDSSGSIYVTGESYGSSETYSDYATIKDVQVITPTPTPTATATATATA